MTNVPGASCNAPWQGSCYRLINHVMTCSAEARAYHSVGQQLGNKCCPQILAGADLVLQHKSSEALGNIENVLQFQTDL